MAIFEKKNKGQKDSDPQDDYRAPSDTGPSTEPDVVAGAGDKDLSKSPGLQPGATTTTTTDSVLNKGAVETQSPAELDKRSPEDRLEQLRGWRKKFRTQSPQSADWEEFEELIGDGRSVADARRAT